MAKSKRNQAFFVVGHANWGKSSTLKALTNGSVRVRQISLGNRQLFIRRMSNDDRPHSEWVRRIMSLQNRGRSHLMLTLCPKPNALPFLRQLARTYRLYFWVMRHSYKNGLAIPAQEEAALRSIGNVRVFNQQAQASVRAADFRVFILAHP